MTCELYCCLLPQCEALRICRLGFPIATVVIPILAKRAIPAYVLQCVSPAEGISWCDHCKYIRDAENVIVAACCIKCTKLYLAFPITTAWPCCKHHSVLRFKKAFRCRFPAITTVQSCLAEGLLHTLDCEGICVPAGLP